VDHILNNTENIQVTESFMEVDGVAFSLGESIFVENGGTTMLLSDLQGQFNSAVQQIAQGDLSAEEWENLDPADRQGRLLGAYTQAGPSPTQQIMERIQNGIIEKIEERRTAVLRANE